MTKNKEVQNVCNSTFFYYWTPKKFEIKLFIVVMKQYYQLKIIMMSMEQTRNPTNENENGNGNEDRRCYIALNVIGYMVTFIVVLGGCAAALSAWLRPQS